MVSRRNIWHPCKKSFIVSNLNRYYEPFLKGYINMELTFLFCEVKSNGLLSSGLEKLILDLSGFT